LRSCELSRPAWILYRTYCSRTQQLLQILARNAKRTEMVEFMENMVEKQILPTKQTYKYLFLASSYHPFKVQKPTLTPDSDESRIIYFDFEAYSANIYGNRETSFTRFPNFSILSPQVNSRASLHIVQLGLAYKQGNIVKKKIWNIEPGIQQFTPSSIDYAKKNNFWDLPNRENFPEIWGNISEFIESAGGTQIIFVATEGRDIAFPVFKTHMLRHQLQLPDHFHYFLSDASEIFAARFPNKPRKLSSLYESVVGGPLNVEQKAAADIEALIGILQSLGNEREVNEIVKSHALPLLPIEVDVLHGIPGLSNESIRLFEEAGFFTMGSVYQAVIDGVDVQKILSLNEKQRVIFDWFLSYLRGDRTKRMVKHNKFEL